MPTAGQTVNQINRMIRFLVEVGLATDQNFAYQRSIEGHGTEITFPNASFITIALKGIPYDEIYRRMADLRAYNAKMPDGAIMQMLYRFDRDGIKQHRLAFFPAPHLDRFQDNPDIYMHDEIYADIVGRSIVPFPVRFDFDDDAHEVIDHPKSHMTLGQYENCRVPVTAPMTPFWFVDFLLRNFYHAGFYQYATRLPRFVEIFEDSIVPAERRVVHLAVPT